MRIRLTAACGAMLALGMLGGCVVAPAPYPGYVQTPAYPGYVVVPGPPPAPRVEVVGVAPYPGSIWISGYWSWGGVRYAWTPGRWAAPPPGQVWIPPRWEPHGNAWREHPGHWGRR